MGIFIKRPLCLFCFCFIASSLVACMLDGTTRIFLAVLSVVLFATLLFASRSFKKRRIGIISAAISIIFCFVAFLESYLAILLPQRTAQRLESESDTVVILVLDEIYSSEYSSKYFARLEYAGGEECSISSYLLCEYESDYKPGDVVCFVGSISQNSDSDAFGFPPERALTVVSSESERVVVNKYEGFDLQVMCAKLREKVQSVLYNRLDEETAAFSVGLLIGKTDMMDAQTVRDFLRAGLSHIMAVSGLHLVVLVGGAEFVLRRLGVKKGIRCLLFGILATLLLVLSGFSGSACRSVIMLVIAYIMSAMSRESDALTSLGVAGFLIILFSPSSVGDIGFWLSFLATLGLVSWLAIADKYINIRNKKGRLRHILSALITGALVTYTAGVFVSIISCFIFREISLVSIPANLAVTPLANVYLFFIPIIIFFGGIPILHVPIRLAASFWVYLIRTITSFFSGFGFSVISLNYPFARVITVCLAICIMVMLIIRMKRKYFILFPPIIATAAFFVCLSVHSAIATPLVSLADRGGQEAIVVSDGGSSIVVDLGDGRYSSLSAAAIASEENCATEFEALVLSRYRKSLPSSVDSFVRGEMVRELYLPIPCSQLEYELAMAISDIAERASVKLSFYKRMETISIDEVSIVVSDVGFYENGSESLSVLLGVGESAVCYAEASWQYSSISETTGAFLEVSEAALLGRRRIIIENGSIQYKLPLKIAVIDGVSLISAMSAGTSPEIYYPRVYGRVRICTLPVK